MTGPIYINPKQLVLFDSHRFTELCNELLRAEASRVGISPHLIDTTVRDTVPDGGIDARVRAADETTGDPSDAWLPHGNSAWQYKSGKCPSANTLKDEEFSKSEVIAAIERGDTYCFVTAQSITAKKQEEIRDAIEACYRERGQEPRCRVYTATELAEWAREHLAIAHRHFGLALAGWQPFEQWSQARQFRNTFHPDESRREIIDAVRAAISSDDRIVRILGHSGVGKTRAVMEAVRTDGLRERVLYLGDAAEYDPQFFWHLQQNNPDGSGILVVDECTADIYPQLRDLAEGLPTGFTMIAIGPLEYRAAGGALELGQLGIDELTSILEDFAPQLTEAERRAIAARCGGSPKLLVALAREIASGRDTIRGWEEVERSRDVVEYLNERLFPVDNASPAAKVMRALSLFTRLGWSDDVAVEGRTVMDFFRVDWDVAREAADELVERGVISKRGRFLYPTPDVLANYLTRKTIRVRGAADLNELFGSLPEGAQRSFAERLRQLGDDPETRGVVEEIVGGAGFFSSLEVLNDRATARLLRLLAPAYPESTLTQLERILNSADRDSLLDFGVGRRDVMWALEDLAWWREHFPAAARLIRRLAWAENEEIANNATGIWQRLFQVMLGGTAAPFEERLPILREALHADDPAMRRLGVLALGAALQTGQIMRVGGPPEDTGRLPPEEWRPRTYAEWGEIIRGCLEELEAALDDPDAAVRAQAVEVLEKRGGELINAGFLEDWAVLARRLVDEPFEMREPLLRLVNWRLRHADDLEDEQTAVLRELEADLAGDSFSDRLRRIVSLWDYNREYVGDPGADQILDELVEEALADSSQLERELPWLLGGDANSGFLFGKELGRRDEDDTLFDLVVGAWSQQVNDDRFITGYLAGVAERRGSAWIEDQLDDWAADPELSLLVANTTWRVLGSERAARRLTRLIDEGHLPGAFVGRLVAGFWARDIPPEVFGELLSAASKDKSAEAVSGRTAVLDQYLHMYPDRLAELKPLVEEALDEGAEVSGGPMHGYHWKCLVERVIEDEPLRVVRLCLKLAERERHPSLDRDFQQLLERALTIVGWRGFEEVIAPAILEDPALLWKLENPILGRSLFSTFDPDDVVQWIEEDVEERLSLVAHATPVGGTSLSGLARALLVRWGDRNEVRAALAATFGTGSWMGSASGWLAGKLREAEAWSEDPDPNVRRWAQELAQTYRLRLKRARLLEEEEDRW